MVFNQMKTNPLFLLIAVIGTALLTAAPEKGTDTLNYEVLPLAIEADPETKDFLEDFLIEIPELKIKGKKIKYHIRIVEPDPNIEYKILKAELDPNIDFKLRIIEPNTDIDTSKTNTEISEKLTELLKKSKSRKKEK